MEPWLKLSQPLVTKYLTRICQRFCNYCIVYLVNIDHSHICGRWSALLFILCSTSHCLTSLFVLPQEDLYFTFHIPSFKYDAFILVILYMLQIFHVHNPIAHSWYIVIIIRRLICGMILSYICLYYFCYACIITAKFIYR